jgi:hypothetical protein
VVGARSANSNPIKDIKTDKEKLNEQEEKRDSSALLTIHFGFSRGAHQSC